MSDFSYFRHRSQSQKSRSVIGSRTSLQQSSDGRYLLEQHLQQRYGILRPDENFEQRSDLVSSKQIYEMLEAAHPQNKQNNFTFKKGINGQKHDNEEELARRLEKAQKQIEVQKRRVRELQGNIEKTLRHTQPSEDKQSTLHRRFIERVQQMMYSVEGEDAKSLQEVWRWLKNKMDECQKNSIKIQRISKFIKQKQLVRAQQLNMLLESNPQ